MIQYCNYDIKGTLAVSGNATFASDITVSGGDITLGGTGRIQGVDTVSANTDAANKLYVDNAVSGVPQGDITNISTTSPITGGGSSGSVTIAHANSGVTAATYTAATIAVNATGHITSATSNTIPTNNNQLTNGAGYITSASLPSVGNGTLTMTTNTGLDGSATFTANQSGNSAFAVSLDLTEISLGAGLDSTATGLTLDLSEFTDMTAGMTATDEFIVLDSGAERRKAAGEIGNSIFSNTANYITSASLPTVNNATITINAGTNLTTGGNFTTNQSSNETITINMATGGVGAGTYGSTSDSIKIDNITVDAYGRVTGVTTGATGQVNTINTGNANTLTKSGSTTVTLTPNTGAVSSSSSNLATGAQIQTAINSAVTGVLKYQGTWNASTNSPSLSSGSGTPGYYYIVSVAGSTNLDGITDWAVGDWAVFSDQATDAWQKIDNTQVGNVTGSGSNTRIPIWNSSSNLTSDSGLTFNTSSNALTVGGAVTWSGGGSAESNSAYDNMITAFSDSGSSTITLTLTQQDGGTLSTSFSNPQGTMSSFVINTATGLDGGATVTDGGTVNLSLDLSEFADSGTLVGTDHLISLDGNAERKSTISSIPLSIFNNNSGFTSFAEPGIFSGGGTPTLASGVTGAEIRTLIGAGTSSSSGVTSVGAGDGLTGGGTSASVTLNAGAGTGITVNADDIAVTPAQTGITSIYYDGLDIGGVSGVNEITFEASKIAFTASSTSIGNIYSGGFRPNTNNTMALGTSTSKWSSVYATTFLGDLNGTINTATTGVTQSQGNNSTKIATTAYVDSYDSGVQVINEGVGIKKSGTASSVTISANYDSGDTDNLIFGANAITAAVATKPYTPYILAADSNPGVSFGEVKNLRLQSIPLDRFGDATSTIDMGGNKILDVADPTLAQDAATKAYVDANSGSGTVTGTGASTRVAFWSSSSALTSDADLTFTTATNRLSSRYYIIPNDGDYLGTDTSGNARTLISLTSGNDVEVSNTALSSGSDTIIYFGDNFRIKDGGAQRFSIPSNGTMSNSGNTFNSGPINLEEDNKITFDDDGDQWNWIQATSGEMEMAVGSTLTLTNVEESNYGDIKINSLYRIISSGVTTNATYIPIYTDSASSTVPRFQRTQTPSQFLSNAGAITGSGTSGRVAFFTGTRTQSSDTLYWNSSTNVLGINYSGSTFNSGALQIQGPTSNTGPIGLQIYNSTTGSPYGSHGIFVNGPRYGNAGISVKNPNTGSTFMRFYTNSGSSIGTITQSGSSSTSYNTSSDYRLKENIEPMTGSIERLKALKPSRFNFINEAADEKGIKNKVDGFIAHEAAGVVPEAVTGQKDALNYEGEPEYQSIDQSKLVPLLTSALQEALAKIELLETRLDTLEQKK